MSETSRYVVGAYKIPAADRDVSGPVLSSPDAGYHDIIDSNDDPDIPLGSNVTFRAELTDGEAERFRAASNARYVEFDQIATSDPIATPATGRRNLVENPSFETNVTGWTSSDGAPSRITSSPAASAGNRGVNVLDFPAAYSRDYPNVHSSVAFDETTSARASFSNYHKDASGVAPGVNCLSLDKDGNEFY